MPASSAVAAPAIPAIPRDRLEIDATVLICTFNRAGYLDRTLASLARTSAPGLGWDVIVVDNNSSDNTRAVVQNWIPRFPVALRYLFEPRQGKSNALNTGMREARAAVIAFTDDDVLVEPGWLESAVRPLLDRADIDYTGGPVRPIWSAPRPQWLDIKGNLGGVIAVKDHGPEPFIFETAQKTPLGVNMAVRRTLVERVGGFRPDLGRNGRSLLGQEQAEFFYRTRQAGARGLYVPEMVLDHVVADARLTRKYFRRWWYWKGVSHARVHQLHGRTELGIDLDRVPTLLGVPRFIVAGAFRHLRSYLSAALTHDPGSRTEHWLALAYCLGYARERVASIAGRLSPRVRHRAPDRNAA